MLSAIEDLYTLNDQQLMAVIILTAALLCIVVVVTARGNRVVSRETRPMERLR